MCIATRHRDDSPPDRASLPELSVQRETDAALMAAVQGVPEAEILRRFESGHLAYLAWWDGWPAARGWIATRCARIGEVSASFTVPDGERYLWNFVTLEKHRGKGIYPRFLDAIVRAESRDAERFWIAYAPENHASASGIHKAGFVTVADLSFDSGGRPAVRARVRGAGAEAARLLGLPAVREALAPCWRCVRRGTPSPSCCDPGRCSCDYQRIEAGCA